MQISPKELLKIKRQSIVGLKGSEITDEERKILHNFKPKGIILFERNLENSEKIKYLISELKQYVDWIALDQEGGLVDRLKKINNFSYDSAKNAQDKILEYITMQNSSVAEACKNIVYKQYNIMGKQLKELGFNLNFAPVIDLEGFHDAEKQIFIHSQIGKEKRSFGSEVLKVVECGMQAILGLHNNGIQPCPKHAPGLGRALKDTHHESTMVNKVSVITLMENDFAVFQQIAARTKIQPELKQDFTKVIMVSHAKFEYLDFLPFSTSERCLDFLKYELGFKDYSIITDDLRMKALTPNDRMNAYKLAIKYDNYFIMQCDPIESYYAELDKFLVS